MSHRDIEAQTHFTQPVRQIIIMVLVLALVAAGGYIAWPRVAPVFLANLWLNGFIALVFIFGVLTCFSQMFQLVGSVTWIVGFAESRPGHQITRAPRLLAPLAALLRARGSRTTIGSAAGRSILDSVATRIDEARDITRYIVNLLIFLGLLGTFYGLATTVPAVVETIRSLAPQEGEGGIDVFSRLMDGLEAQLGGMGVAFSSSLLGLAGSLVVGLMEIFAGHGQNRFYRELEEWLSTFTRVGYGASEDASGAGEGGGHMVAALDQIVQQMDALQALYVDSDVSRSQVDESLARVVTSFEILTDKIDSTETASDAANDTVVALERIAEGQEKLIALLGEKAPSPEAPVHDAESRMHLRALDKHMVQLMEELSAGRQESMADLRKDIASLTRALRDLKPEQKPEFGPKSRITPIAPKITKPADPPSGAEG